MAEIQHYDISLDAGSIEDEAKRILKLLKPMWNMESIKFQQFTEGITNILIGCYQPEDKNDMVLVRVFGEKTELIVDREAEKETFILLRAAGCSPPLYCTFNNGMAYGFVKGKPLDKELARDNNVRKLIAKEVARYHSLRKDQNSRGDNSIPEPFIISKIQKFLTLIPEGYPDEERQNLFAQELKSKSALQKEFDMLRKHLESLNSDVVFSHNDLLLQNIIFDSQENQVRFIDYEYAAYNFQAYDIGNHFNTFAGLNIGIDTRLYPDTEFQLSWIRTYLEEYSTFTGQQKPPNDQDVECFHKEVNKCALAANFFWGLWALIQAEHSKIDFDYLRYGIYRIKEYFRRRDEFLSNHDWLRMSGK